MALDWALLNGIQDVFGSAFMDWLMPAITSLGNAGIIWIVIAVCMIISKQYRKTGILVLAGLLLGLIIGNCIVKNLVARQRPNWLNPNFKLLIPNPKDFSFPSGHTQSSVIAATIITLSHKKMGWVVIPLAVMIAFSRLYLYVHFPSDIIGGALMGLTIGAVTYVVGKRIINKIDSTKVK